jgi:NAD+ kinase
LRLKKPLKQLLRVGVTGNAEKPDFGLAVREAVGLLRQAGRKVFCDVATARAAGLKLPVRRDTATLTRDVDLLLVFGGDGTMLGVAREVAGLDTPILGINIGGLGFLTAVSTAELAAQLECIWRGAFRLESRPLIEASWTGGRKPLRWIALNDFVISRGQTARLIELEVAVDDEPLTRFRCDGLVVSSPTGSTAYSLAAGGALICPTAEVFSLTPICPHTLSNRSVIVGLDSTIRVKIIAPRPATVLCADGQLMRDLNEGDVVTICRSERAIRLMHLPGTSFFETLRRKLHWRGASF